MKILDQFQQIQEYFSPRVIGEVNDVYIKLAKIKGDKIPWHNHEKEDELFYVLEGELKFEEAGKSPFILLEGEMHIVKKGVNHKVSADEECKIMLIEQKTTSHTGTVVSEITKTIAEQLNK